MLRSTLVVWALAGATLLGQQTTGNIAGRVLDPQSQAMAGASVTAVNPATGFSRTETTDSQGVYRLLALPVGTYQVRAERSGFAASNVNVEVDVAETVSLDISMRLAGITESVVVTAAPPLVNTTSSAVGQVVDVNRVSSLPLNGRQFANLIATVPGVGLGFHLDPTKGVNYAPQVDGGAGRNLNYQIDGGDNNDDTVGGLLQQYPLESIEQFNVLTARYKAEYGRSSGAVVNVITKSGTNRLQSSLFELFRDKSMNAVTESEKLAAGAGTPHKGDYRRNQFGGSLGGPIVEDKVHFFVAIERTAQDTTQPVSTKGLYPSLDGSHGVAYRENLDTAKLTFNLPNGQYASIRYAWNDNSFPYGAGPTTTPDNWGNATNRFNSINLNHNWVFSGDRLNEFVFQFANYQDAIAAASSAPNVTFPNGVSVGGSLAAPQATEQKKVQFRDDVSWHLTGHGGLGHDFKAGVNVMWEPRLFISNTTGKGIVSYTMLDNSVTGKVARVSLSDGDSSVNIPNTQYGFYVQDDWRAGSRLTLNLGVRYDLVTGLAFDQSKNPNFVKIQAAARAGLLGGIVGLENFGLSAQSDRNNIQPRVGAVYDIRGDGKDILRGGWGVYTDFGYTNSNVLLAALDASGTHFGPTFDTGTAASGLKNPDGTFFQVGQPLSNLASQNTVAPGAFAIQGQWANPRLQEPYQLQTNVGWSHELTPSTVVTVDYVNSLGRDLNYKPRLNQLIPGTALRRISSLLPSPLSPNNSSNRPVLSVGRSRYNALMLGLNRRLSRGFDLSASYTLSSSLSTIGNASDELNTANVQDPNNPFNSPVQMGPDVLTDARHRVNISAIVQLPYGIQIAPIFMYRSALPIYLVDGRDLNKDGDKFDIPAEAFAVGSTDPATGKTTVKDIGACTTVNCGRGWPQSQVNVRISKSFPLQGRARVELIGEVFNLFNAINPSNIVSGGSVNRTVYTSAGAPDPTLLQPASYSGDTQRPEQRVGQIGLRFSF